MDGISVAEPTLPLSLGLTPPLPLPTVLLSFLGAQWVRDRDSLLVLRASFPAGDKGCRRRLGSRDLVFQEGVGASFLHFCHLTASEWWSHPTQATRASSTVLPSRGTGNAFLSSAAGERWGKLSRMLHPVRDMVKYAQPVGLRVVPSGCPS